MEKFTRFARIAEIEFSDIVLSTQDLGNKLRIFLKDKTYEKVEKVPFLIPDESSLETIFRRFLHFAKEEI